MPAKFVGSDKAGGFDASELDAGIPAEHRRFVEELLTRYEVPPLTEDVDLRGEMAVGFDQQREVIEMLFEYEIKLIASALGPPPAWMIEQGRTRGVEVAALAGTVEHPRRHAAAGVDIIVAQVYEAGGHTGELELTVLLLEFPKPLRI